MKIILLLVQLIPALIEALKAIEAAIPGSGKGAEKLAMVRSVLEAGWQFSKGEIPFNEAWPAIEKAIGALVAGFNRLGVFQK